MGNADGENTFDYGPPREPPDDYPEGEVSGERFPPPSDPMRVARQLEPEWRENGLLTLRHWRGQWMSWQQQHWTETDIKNIRSWAYERLEKAFYLVMDPKKGTFEPKPWAPTRPKVADLLEAMAAIKHLPSGINPPTWLDGHPNTGRGPIVACANGLLDLHTRELLPLTPGFLNLVSVPFDYQPDAPVPAAWLDFLSQLWGDDEQIDSLQEWFGYTISGRTDQQKIMLIVGPTRSGKGTIARIIGALVGKGNVAGPTLSSLATNFGLSPLLGRPLAVISDARLGGHDTHQVTERLLTISGEDAITVDRKYRDPWTGQLPVRIMILSNELPSFGDSSGVIAHRMITLSLTKSWLGRENTALTEQLGRELPGILNWALEGLDRLDSKGRFTEPASSREAAIIMKDSASPMSAFIRDCCNVGAGLEVDVDALWTRWRSWCLDNGRERSTGSKQRFGRNLRSVAPGVRLVRFRDGDDRNRVYQGIELKTQARPGWSNADPFVRNSREGEDQVRAGSAQGPRSEGSGSAHDLHGHAGPRKTETFAYAPACEPTTPTMASYADLRDPAGDGCTDTSHTPKFRIDGSFDYCPDCNPPVDDPADESDPWGQPGVDLLDAEINP